MTVMEVVFREEFDRLQRMKKAMLRDYNELPKGYISTKKINGRTYYYLQKREGNRIKSRYIKSDELETLQHQMKIKAQLKESLKDIEYNLKLLRRVLKDEPKE